MGEAEPAGLASSCDAVVHHVIGDQEEGLQELDAPAEHRRLHPLSVAQRVTLCLGERLLHGHEGEPAIHLPARHSVLDHVLHPLHSLRRHLVDSGQIRDNLFGHPNTT